MEARPQSTFIPKKPVTSSGIARKGIGFLSLISLVIFLATVVVCGGMYIYRSTLAKTVAAKEIDLQKNEKVFDPKFTKSIVDLSNRIEVSKLLLDKHMAASSIFGNLQKYILKNVQITDFTFTSAAASQGGGLATAPIAKITIRGLAKDYNSLAYQAEAMIKNTSLKDQVFSSFSLTDTGQVTFSFEAVVEPALINYRSRFAEGSVNSIIEDEPVVPIATSSATTTSSTSTNKLRP